MNQNFKDMVYLFSCGAQNIIPQINCELNLQEILKYSKDQGVFSTVFLSIRELYYNNILINVSEEQFENLNNIFLLLSTKYERKKIIVEFTLDKLKEKNIKFCILKGGAVADLYANPECRISNDVDILVDLKDENKTCKLLKNMGFDIDKRKKNSHHFTAINSEGVILEVHTSLYNIIYAKLWFNNCKQISEPFYTYKNKDGKVMVTLGINDNIKFLTLHMIKHFLNRGVGIRQVMDVLLFMKVYKKEINWLDYWSFMEKLKFEKLIKNLIGLGIEYLHIEKKYLPEVEYNLFFINEIMNDIQSGGIFGRSDTNRDCFFKVYSINVLKSIGYKDYTGYIKKNLDKSYYTKILPDFKTMKTQYHYLKDKWWLLPIAWIHRFVDILISIIRKDKNLHQIITTQLPDDNNETIKNRMDLIRKLDML